MYIYMYVLFIVLFMVNSLPMIEKVPDISVAFTPDSRAPGNRTFTGPPDPKDGRM